jgi:hypothetical protein
VTGWRGMFTGMLALVALEAVVSRTEAAGRIGGALTGLAGMVSHLLSPAEPLVPDLRAKKAAATPKPDSRKGGGGGLIPGVPDPLDLLSYSPHRPAPAKAV